MSGRTTGSSSSATAWPGARFVEELVARGGADRFDVTVFGEEPSGNYNRILLSSVLAGSHQRARHRHQPARVVRRQRRRRCRRASAWRRSISIRAGPAATGLEPSRTTRSSSPPAAGRCIPPIEGAVRTPTTAIPGTQAAAIRRVRIQDARRLRADHGVGARARGPRWSSAAACSGSKRRRACCRSASRCTWCT